MCRLPPPARSSLTPEAQLVWDTIGGPRVANGGGPSTGPYGVLIRHAALAEQVEALGRALRFRGELDGATRELAILTAGRELGAQFEWYAHEPIARREGVRPEAIELVRAGGASADLQPHERIVVNVVRSLYQTRSVPDGLYQRAISELGEVKLIELVTLAGFYGLIGFLLLGFEVEPPAGATFFRSGDGPLNDAKRSASRAVSPAVNDTTPIGRHLVGLRRIALLA